MRRVLAHAAVDRNGKAAAPTNVERRFLQEELGRDFEAVIRAIDAGS